MWCATMCEEYWVGILSSEFSRRSGEWRSQLRRKAVGGICPRCQPMKEENQLKEMEQENLTLRIGEMSQ